MSFLINILNQQQFYRFFLINLEQTKLYPLMNTPYQPHFPQTFPRNLKCTSCSQLQNRHFLKNGTTRIENEISKSLIEEIFKIQFERRPSQKCLQKSKSLFKLRNQLRGELECHKNTTFKHKTCSGTHKQNKYILPCKLSNKLKTTLVKKTKHACFNVQHTFLKAKLTRFVDQADQQKCEQKAQSTQEQQIKRHEHIESICLLHTQHMKFGQYLPYQVKAIHQDSRNGTLIKDITNKCSQHVSNPRKHRLRSHQPKREDKHQNTYMHEENNQITYSTHANNRFTYSMHLYPKPSGQSTPKQTIKVIEKTKSNKSPITFTKLTPQQPKDCSVVQQSNLKVNVKAEINTALYQSCLPKLIKNSKKKALTISISKKSVHFKEHEQEGELAPWQQENTNF